ncbi:cytochrome P450 [Nonomuraea endophytica]|uniref:cytochrome P450 n=1 Tax=Nonomuraea endophytica TaxID=714136 RepID=UPI0037C52C5B
MTLPADFTLNPYPELDRRRALAPVTPVELMPGASGWLVTGHALGRTLPSDARLTRQAPDGTHRPFGPADIGPTLLELDPPGHTRLRRLVQRAFTGRRVAGLRPAVEGIAAGLLADLSHADEADLISRYALPLPIAVISDLMGVPVEERETVRRSTRDLLTGEGGPRDARERTETAMALTRAYLRDLVARKRAHPGEDLTSGAYAAEDLDLDGAAVAKGEQIFISLHAANRDPAVFPGPATLDITRDPNPHLAFGHGVHHCRAPPWPGWKARSPSPP